MNRATWIVTYVPRNGKETLTAEVQVDMSGAQFYATNLGLWGCGKMAYSPAGAIRMLVQDMATIVSMTPKV